MSSFRVSHVTSHRISVPIALTLRSYLSLSHATMFEMIELNNKTNLHLYLTATLQPTPKPSYHVTRAFTSPYKDHAGCS